MLMNKIMLTTVAACALAGPVFATTGNSGNGNGGCGVGQQTNGCGVPAGVGGTSGGSAATSEATGGNATGGNATIGASSLSNTSAITNTNTSTSASSAAVGNVGSSSTVGDLSTGPSTASVGNLTTGASTASTGASTAAVGNLTTGASNATTGASTANSDQSQATSNANNSSVTVAGDAAQARNPVSTAYSASLTSGIDTCMGSSSAGAQGVGFGISIGSTWTDKNCARLKNARQLVIMGHRAAAVQLMCLNPEIKLAMSNGGTPCATVRGPAQ